MSKKQNLTVKIKEEKDLIEQYKKDVQSEAYRLTIEDINQRLNAGQEISDEEREKIIENNLEKILANTKTLSPNEFHKMICKILMLMAVIGGIFAFIGFTLAPESCASHEDTIWETLGIALFIISMFGVPINIIIWLISLFYSKVDSPQILVWVFFHTIVVIISMAIFVDYIIQDMFCGCFGFPGEDCS